MDYQEVINALLKYKKEHQGTQGQCIQSQQRNTDRVKWIGNAISAISILQAENAELLKRYDNTIKCLEKSADTLLKDAQIIMDMRKENAELRAMLKRLEWAFNCNECPICFSSVYDGHAESCGLSRLIKEGENDATNKGI